MPLPSDQLRQAVMDAIAKSRLGVRRFEAKHGLHKWELRGILDPARRQSPSVDKARKICEALGLEFYIGPPRKSTITELKEKLLTQEEQKAIPPEVERALESIIADRLDQEKLLSEAAAHIEKILRRLEEAASVRRQSMPTRTPGGVPVEIARALDLPDDCTLKDALVVTYEAMAALAEHRKTEEILDDLDQRWPASEVPVRGAKKRGAK